MCGGGGQGGCDLRIKKKKNWGGGGRGGGEGRVGGVGSGCM